MSSQNGRRCIKTATAVLALAPLLCGAGYADVSRYRAPLAGGEFIGISSSEALAPGQVALGTSIALVSNPLTWRYEDDTYDPVVGQQLNLELMAGMGLLPYVDLGVGVPVSLVHQGRRSLELGNPHGAGFGDVRLVPRITLLPERIFGPGLGFISEVTLPTGAQGRFLGERSLSWRPRVVATAPVWGMRVVGSLGYLLRRNAPVADLSFGDEITFELAAAQPTDLLGRAFTALYELAGATAAAEPLRGDGRTALEARAGLRTRVLPTVEMTGALGVGLTQGVGTPMARFLLSVAYVEPVSDRDADRVPDPVDACPDEPESYNRYADLDGCPDDPEPRARDDAAAAPAAPAAAPPPTTNRDTAGHAGAGAQQDAAEGGAFALPETPMSEQAPGAEQTGDHDTGEPKTPAAPGGDDATAPEPFETVDDGIDIGPATAPRVGPDDPADGP